MKTFIVTLEVIAANSYTSDKELSEDVKKYFKYVNQSLPSINGTELSFVVKNIEKKEHKDV